MLTLLLLRHAKSSWDHPVLSDFDRPLNKRGRRAAPRMGGFIAAQDLTPDLVLCSSARRARETLDLLLPELPAKPKVKYREELYLAAPAVLLSRIRAVSDKYSRLLVVGHNPGLHALALALCAAGDDAARRDLAGKFPTGALAVFSFELPAWRRLEQATGYLELFEMPRRLEQS